MASSIIDTRQWKAFYLQILLTSIAARDFFDIILMQINNRVFHLKYEQSCNQLLYILGFIKHTW